MKKILLLDFDGVLHSYSSGWKGADVVADPPVDGAIDWLRHFILRYCSLEQDWQVNIYSARSGQSGGVEAMQQWLLKYGLDKMLVSEIQFPTKKPPAFLTVDDRAIQFQGLFEGLDEEILTFQPWNKRSG